MAIQLKPLNEQVIVITGASSGIGLATSRKAAIAGACPVLVCRSVHTIGEIAEEIVSHGGQSLAMECDVSVRADIEQVATQVIAKFGRIDTWINNAGIGIYGRLDEVTDDDARRVFDVNYWGVVYGSLVALPYLRQNGGALINVGSEVSEAYVPLLGAYTASKHAVKGFTDTLRVEIEEVDQAPVSITLIQPTAVDTPFPQHARNYQTQEPKLPDPKIQAEQVAEAILDAAVHPTRAKRVGLMATVNTLTAKLMPAVADRMVKSLAEKQHRNEAPRNPQGILNQSSESIGTAGQIQGVPTSA